MKGQKTGGRKAGTPNKVTAEIRAASRQLFDEAYFTGLKARISEGKAAPAVECRMLAYAFGEPSAEGPLDDLVNGLSRVIIELKDRRSRDGDD